MSEWAELLSRSLHPAAIVAVQNHQAGKNMAQTDKGLLDRLHNRDATLELTEKRSQLILIRRKLL
jgi:hypothetical protein